jgi:hypothetical protein
MTGAKALLDLQSLLLGTGLVQPVSSSSGAGGVEVLCRQVPGQEEAWLEVAKKLLEAIAGWARPDALHLCRRYVWRDGKMVFGWHLGLHASAKELAEVLALVRPILESARPRLGEAPARRRAPAAPEEPQEGVLAGSRPAQGARAAPVQPIRVVRSEIDEDGNPIIEEEMPLPHVTRELAAPRFPGDKGANRTASTGRSRRT